MLPNIRFSRRGRNTKRKTELIISHKIVNNKLNHLHALLLLVKDFPLSFFFLIVTIYSGI